MSNEELSRLLTEQYPLVHRLARGLCGETKAAAVTKIVFRGSLRVCDRWRDELAAGNWLLHQVLLHSRNFSRASKANPLWTGEAAERIEARPIIRAFAGMPFQQREAILLSRGEKLGIQRIAISMDCSTTAATTHLAAAEKMLATFGGPEAERMIGLLLAAYSAPPPAGDLIVTRTVRRDLRRRIVRQLIRLAMIVLVLAAAWAGWLLYKSFFH